MSSVDFKPIASHCRCRYRFGLATLLLYMAGATAAGADGPIDGRAQSGPERQQRIEVFKLVGNAFTDADLANIAHLEQVHKLQLERTAISFAAVDQLVEAHPNVQCFQALSETLYEAYREPYASGFASLTHVLSAYDEALGWKLDIAPFKGGSIATRRAHEQYLQALAEIRRILEQKSAAPQFAFEMALADCAVARGKMRLAMCQGKSAEALAAGRAAQTAAEQLPSLAWQQFLDGRDRYESAAIAIRLSKDVRIQVARLGKNLEAERKVREDMIACYRAAVRELFKRYGTEFSGEDCETLALAATLLSAEEASLARFAGTETRDTWQRARQRADILTHVEIISTGEYIPHMTEVLLKSDLASDVDIADARVRSDAAAVAKLQHAHTLAVERFARMINALYQVGARGGEHEAWTYLACKMMRCRLRENCGAAYRMKQHDFDKLLYYGSESAPRVEYSRGPEVDWRRELTPDERGQLSN